MNTKRAVLTYYDRAFTFFSRFPVEGYIMELSVLKVNTNKVFSDQDEV